MFTYALLRGIRKGFIPAKEYKPVALDGYSLLKNKFLSHNANGTLNWEGTVQVGSLSGNGTFEVGLPPWSYRNCANFGSITSLSQLSRTITRVLGLSCMPATSWRRTE
jgi:rhamnogalacturonyl hydrolase YesR